MSALAASAILRPEREPRSHRFWIAVAASVALHVLVLGAWLWFGSGQADKVPPPTTMDVTIADDVGLTASAPQAETPPAQSQAPDLGSPEDSAPPPPAPTPEKTETKPTPPKPQPAAVAPPKPAEVAKPQPQKVAPPSPKPAKVATPRPPSSSLASIVGKGSGTNGTSTKTPRGSSLGSILKGLGDTPTKSTADKPQGAVMSAAATMDITRKIAQQIQPCAQRQSLSAPGVGKIRVIVALSFSSDGNPSAAPRIVRLEGVDDDNERYADQVRQRALAAFQDRACQPIRGLPPELYDVPKGWRSVTLGFKLPG